MFLAVPVAWACAGPLWVVDGGYRDRERGFWVAEPPPVTPPWQRAEVKGAILSFRRPGPTWMSLQLRCKVPLTRPQILARHLRIGLPDHTLRESYATEAGGYRGWAQVFDVSEEGSVVRVKTVTLVAHGCAFDWILTAHAGAGFEASQASFDAWWPTLRFDSDDATETP